MNLIRETPTPKRVLRAQRPYRHNPRSYPLARATMTPAEQRLLRSMLGRPFQAQRRRDSVAVAVSLVLFCFLLAAALGYVARIGGW